MSSKTIDLSKINAANLLDPEEIKKTLPPCKLGHRFRFTGIIDKNIEVLKLINKATFPVNYKETFYKQVLSYGPDLSYLAVYDDIPVGCVCCRVEDHRLYIMTLGVLTPYRRLGVGSKLLEKAFQMAQKFPLVTEIYLHVQVSNSEALQFYSRFGFTETGKMENYYEPQVQPRDAIVLTKQLAKK